jgi:hypothetical protein
MSRQTDADFVAMLRDQIDYATEYEREFCEIAPEGIEMIVEELEDLHRRRTSDFIASDIASAKSIVEWCEELLAVNPGLDAHREIARLLAKVCGATP